MKRIFKIFILIIGCNLFFISAVEAGLFKIRDDKCNIIQGKWKGYLEQNRVKDCVWEGELYGSFKNKIFELSGDLNRTDSSDPECDKQFHVASKQKCIDGNIRGDFNGYISVDGNIYLTAILWDLTLSRR